MPNPKIEYNERYQEHAVSMGRLMREAGDHIAANAMLDLDPQELREEIGLIIITLREAEYHAEQMHLYARLMGYQQKPKVSPLRKDKVSQH